MRHAHHGAVAAGVTKNTTFEVAKAKEFPGYNLSLVSIACARQGQQAEWAQSLRNVAAAFLTGPKRCLATTAPSCRRGDLPRTGQAVRRLDWLCHPDKSNPIQARDRSCKKLDRRFRLGLLLWPDNCKAEYHKRQSDPAPQ